MASGVPVVSADAPNARTLIEPSRTGLLCTPNDPQAFAASVSVLANDPSLRAAMGSAAREASSEYSWDEASRSVAAIYNRILAKDI